MTMTTGAHAPNPNAEAPTVPDQRPAPLDPTKPGPLVTAMIDALRERGLKVRAHRDPGHVLIRATHPDIPTDLPDSPIMNAPGFSQEIIFASDRDERGPHRRYAWYLLWGGTFRGAGTGELQRIAAGEDVDNAADVVRKILHVGA